MDHTALHRHNLHALVVGLVLHILQLTCGDLLSHMHSTTADQGAPCDHGCQLCDAHSHRHKRAFVSILGLAGRLADASRHLCAMSINKCRTWGPETMIHRVESASKIGKCASLKELAAKPSRSGTKNATNRNASPPAHLRHGPWVCINQIRYPAPAPCQTAPLAGQRPAAGSSPNGPSRHRSTSAPAPSAPPAPTG